MNENENTAAPQYQQPDPQQLPPQPPAAQEIPTAHIPSSPQTSTTASNPNINQYHPLNQPQSVTSPASKRSMFSDRIGRLGYFIGQVYLIIPIFLVWVMAYIVMPVIQRTLSESTSNVLAIIVLLFAAVTVAMTILAVLSLYFRRIHDVNRSGFWLLLLLVPIVSFFFGLYLQFAPGTKGVNQYGEPESSLGFLQVLGFKRP